MKSKMKSTALILSLGLFLGLAGCGNNSAKTPVDAVPSVAAKADPITLRMEGSNVGTPNPFRHTTRGPGMARMRLLYDSLLEKNETEDIPWLAKSWDISEDGTVYTFHLQENVLWHDGEPLTAEDVAFTFDYYAEHPPVSNSLIADGEYIIYKAEVIDDITVKITLTHYENTFLSDIGITRIIPKHIWENVEDPLSYDGEGATVGSGPYMLDSYNAEQGAYRYVAFEQYWGLKSNAEAIEWIPVSDSVLAFENGEIDLINATADMLSRYSKDSQYTVQTVPSLHSYRLMMNMEAVTQLQEVNVRKAIAYAIDRQNLIDTVMRGAATLSSAGYVPMESSWYNSDLQQYDYNSEKALELLGGKMYSFKLLTDNSPQGTKTAELIKIGLEEVGIGVTVESVETKTRDNAVNTGKYELLLINSGGLGGDPNYLCDTYGREAKTLKGWNNEAVFELLSAQAVELDESARKDMIYEAQTLIAEEVPMVMLFGAVDNYVYRQDKYAGWSCVYDSNKMDHNKLSYLIR